MILALDISSVCGWAAGVPGQRASCGVWILPKMSEGGGQQAGAYADMLGSAIAVHAPLLVVGEVNCDLHKQNPTIVARQQIGMAYLTELICWRKKVRYREATSEEARQMVLGRSKFGSSPAAKAAVMEWATGEEKYAVPDHNAADALLLWRYACAMSRHHWRVAA